MSYDKLPPGLTAGNDFLLYKSEPGNDGKKKKVPYQVNGARADPGNKAHLTDFKTAYETYQKGGYDGIGKSVKDVIFVIDIDHCIVNGKLNKFAKKILKLLKTYAEVSPSGTGIHIWGRAPNVIFEILKYYIKNSKLGMEVYIGGTTTRFITLTGKALNDLDVNDCSKDLQEVLDTYMVRPTVNQPTVEAPGSFLTDESVLAKMFSAKNADTVKALWNGGMPNITPHVCRHTYCSNMAKSGMNPKTLQYLMGHSDISVTMNVYTHISFDDAEEELKRMEEFRKAQAEIEKKNDTRTVSQKMFKVV